MMQINYASYALAAKKKVKRSYLHTLIPSSEKHGGTAELSSSASLSNIGKRSTADIGISPL